VKEYFAKYLGDVIRIAAFTIAGLFVFTFWQEHEQLKKERLLLEKRYGERYGEVTPFATLDKYSALLATSYKEQVELAKEMALIWKDSAQKEREERIKLLSSATFSNDPGSEVQEGPDFRFKTPDGTKGYLINELRIEGKDSPPLGYVLIKDDGETIKKSYKFEIKVENIQLKDDLTGKIRVLTRAFLVPQENGLAEKRRPDLKKWKDEKYPLEITGGEVTIDPMEPVVPNSPEPALLLWIYNLNVGFGLFANEAEVGTTRVIVDTNLMGYGVSKRDLDWKFFHLGINYSHDSGIGWHVVPISVRPFKNALTNSYIGLGYYGDGFGTGYFLGFNTSL